MTDEVFKQGMAMLTAAFSGITFNMRLYRQALAEIEDEDFKSSVIEAIKTIREIYPGSNLIAILIGIAVEKRRARIDRTPKLQDERCVPPPPEWLEAKKKLGIK